MKFRLYPNQEQERQLLEHCAQARYIWNLALEQKRHYHPRLGASPNFTAQAAQLTEARSASQWLNEGPVVVQQQALLDLDRAYKNWWGNPGHFGKPSWRSKDKHESFRMVGKAAGRIQRLSRKRAQVSIPKIGWVDFRWSKSPIGAKSYRIRRDKAGRWWISFAIIPEQIEGPANGRAIGVDLGVAKSFTTSEGDFYQSPGLKSKESARALRLKRKIARQQKGSNRREQTKRKLARLNHRGINRRKDFIEKLTTQLASQYKTIVVEDIEIGSMTRSARGTLEEPGRRVAAKAGLNKSILESGWGLFRERLEDKAGGRVVRVRPQYTSQTCNVCGVVDKNSRKSQALFSCQSCGHEDHADVNAALNIKAAGQAVAARGGLGEVSQPLKREPQFEPIMV